MVINKVLIKKLRVPIYGSSLWIVISDNITRSIDTVEDLIDKRIEEDTRKRTYDALSYAYEDHDGKYRLMIFLKSTASPGDIAHESHHVVNTVMLWHGIKPSFTNDEAESYLLGLIVDKVHKAFNQYHKQFKNEKTIHPAIRTPLVFDSSAGNNQT